MLGSQLLSRVTGTDLLIKIHNLGTCQRAAVASDVVAATFGIKQQAAPAVNNRPLFAQMLVCKLFGESEADVSNIVHEIIHALVCPSLHLGDLTLMGHGHDYVCRRLLPISNKRFA
jgi:hypothetical protein